MKAHVETDEQYQKRINSKYEYKLVNIGEEVDNRIRELEIEVKDIRKANDNLTRACLLYTSPSPRDKRQSRMPSSA